VASTDDPPAMAGPQRLTEQNLRCLNMASEPDLRDSIASLINALSDLPRDVSSTQNTEHNELPEHHGVSLRASPPTSKEQFASPSDRIQAAKQELFHISNALKLPELQ